MTAWTMPVMLTAAAGLVLLLTSALWANRRYRRFDRLPTHFDIRGNADAIGSRNVVIWLLPTVFAVMLSAICGMFMLVPAEAQNGDPVIGMIFAAIGLVAAQLFILFLTERWVRKSS